MPDLSCRIPTFELLSPAVFFIGGLALNTEDVRTALKYPLGVAFGFLSTIAITPCLGFGWREISLTPSEFTAGEAEQPASSQLCECGCRVRPACPACRPPVSAPSTSHLPAFPCAALPIHSFSWLVQFLHPSMATSTCPACRPNGEQPSASDAGHRREPGALCGRQRGSGAPAHRCVLWCMSCALIAARWSAYFPAVCRGPCLACFPLRCEHHLPSNHAARAVALLLLAGGCCWR